MSGDEAVAHAASDAGFCLVTGYPGTPATEIVEVFGELGGKAQWSPNEKVALEVGIGVAFAGARALVAMKHVGVNVAADPLFTVAYAGVKGALVVVSADDPGMASSQNEQDNRRYAVAAALPMIEPSDSQEAYDYTLLAAEISERWGVPVLLRMTTRVCHSKAAVVKSGAGNPPPPAGYDRDIQGRVMIPAHARPAHRKLRRKLSEIEAWNNAGGPNQRFDGSNGTAIVTSGIAFQHVREADPESAVLKLGMTHPLPMETIRQFAAPYHRIIVVEEGDPYLTDALRAAGIPADTKPEMYRFGELNVARVRRILAGDASPEPAPPRGTPPQLCPGCPYRTVFTILRELNCIVSGDIGCYTLGALPPFEGMDSQLSMGASVGVGLGLRHALPREQAKRVVSVIGDSTFVHSGISGLVEMIYNPPATGHVLLILDNGTTAMTGLQEHPGTGRTLDHHATGKVVFEDLARTLGVKGVHVMDPTVNPAAFRELMASCLASDDLSVVIARRNCLLATGMIKSYEKCDERN